MQLQIKAPFKFVFLLDQWGSWQFYKSFLLHYFPVKEQCLVLFPYTALNEDELTLTEGQTVTIISKDVEDKVPS